MFDDKPRGGRAGEPAPHHRTKLTASSNRAIRQPGRLRPVRGTITVEQFGAHILATTRRTEFIAEAAAARQAADFREHTSRQRREP